MAAHTEPEIILYDLACTKNICFSPVVWRIRLMLNYKGISYKTVFLEFPDIEPTLQVLRESLRLRANRNPDADLKISSGLVPDEAAMARTIKFTVPAIHHVPTNTYMMDSKPISQFLESTYPDPPLPLTSELGSKIEDKARTALGPVFSASVMPREMGILSPRAQEYFRRTREAWLGHPLEDCLEPEREEQSWKSVDDDLRLVGELLLTNKADGPFVLGARPSYTDFFIAGSLQSARVVDEGVFQRNMRHPGYKEVFEACSPYMEKKD